MLTMLEKAKAARAEARGKRQEAQTLAELAEPTAEQEKQFDALIEEADDLDTKADALDRRAKIAQANSEKLAGYSAPQARQAPESTGRQPLVETDGKHNSEKAPAFGFKTPREFLLRVMDAGRGKKLDDRLLPLRAAVGSDEQSGFNDPYGGFVIPTFQGTRILETPSPRDPTAGRTQPMPMEQPRVEIPARVDKNHSTSVAGGLTVTRREEAGPGSASRMQFEKIAFNAHSLMGLAYATEEILTDSPSSFAAILERGFRDAFPAKLLEEKISGTGVGEYLGVLNSPCLITIAARDNSNQISGGDIMDVRTRVYDYDNAIWLANHGTLAQLAAAHVAGTNGDQFLLKLTGQADVPMVLLGRPIFFTEFCPALGTAGDLICGAWNEYIEGTYEPVQGAESMHVRFVNHERAFKFWTRNDGRPWWTSVMTPKNGPTKAPFVAIPA